MAGVNCTFLLNSGGSILLNDGTSVLQMNDITCSAGLANCKFLLNAGGNITLNAGGELQMNRDDCSAGPTPATGGTSGTGTRVRKRVGKQLISDNLGNRPTSVTSGESTARIIFKAKGLTKARWPILKSINESKCIKKPHQMGESVAKIIFKTVNESLSHIYFKHTMESFAIPHPSIQMGRQIRLSKLSMLKEVAQQIFSMDKPSSIRTFEFNESLTSWYGEASQVKLTKMWEEINIKQRISILKKLEVPIADRQTLASQPFNKLPDSIREPMTELKDEELVGFLIGIIPLATAALILNILDASPDTPIDKIKELPLDIDKVKDVKPITLDNPLIAFTHSSSFIGNVRYNTDTLEMRILLNGKAYNFCNVSRRLFDAFEGAGSKGAFFAREIRTLHDC